MLWSINYADLLRYQQCSMRVIETTSLEFVDFGSQMPDEPYSVLSHRWTNNEITHREYKSLDKAALRWQTPHASNDGLDKILWGCHMARLDNVRYFWIDTACINKNNEDDQTELSSSIMSMWKWYHEASVCYVYLATINISAAEVARDSHAFTEWQTTPHTYFGRRVPLEYFRRGWTLQELLAPRRVMFFNATWAFIGTRLQLAEQVHHATNIAKQYINSNESIRLASIAARLSWACGRQTTREEDRVYSLLGLFDVNMDIRYGEGYERAFLRLQREIVDNDPSEDIFAWTSSKLATSGLLAPDIDCFANSGDIDRIWSQDKEPHHLTSKGMKLHIMGRLWHAAREASDQGDRNLRICLPLAAGRRNKGTKQIEIATIELTCVNSRDSPTRLFVRTHCNIINFEATAAASVTTYLISSLSTIQAARDTKRRSQIVKAEEYVAIVVRQEYIFSDEHRRERMEQLRQRFSSFGHDYMSHVYAGEYVHAVPAGPGASARGVVPPRPPRPQSPVIGYAI